MLEPGRQKNGRPKDGHDKNPSEPSEGAGETEGFARRSEVAKRDAHALGRATFGLEGLPLDPSTVSRVVGAAMALPGVRAMFFNPLTEMAYVTFDPALVSEVQVAAALRGAGLKLEEPSWL